MDPTEFIKGLKEVLDEAIEGWGLEHNINCVTQPPWDGNSCDCNRKQFITKCRQLLATVPDIPIPAGCSCEICVEHRKEYTLLLCQRVGGTKGDE